MMMIDNHCHVFQHQAVPPPPRLEGAAYTAPKADAQGHRTHLDRMGATHGVLVQPSAYGTDDHEILLAALRSRPDALRGVACAPPTMSSTELDRFQDAGIRGTRVQDGFPGGVPVEALPEVSSMAHAVGWHVEVWTDLRRRVDTFRDLVVRSAVPVVIDHLGNVPSDEGLDSPVIRMILELIRDGRCWVTLSGLDRLLPSAAPQDPADPRYASAWQDHEARIAERAHAMVEAAPDRVLWGTDWPHVGLKLPHPSTKQLVGRLERWVPDPTVRQLITSTNPATLYGFEDRNE